MRKIKPYIKTNIHNVYLDPTLIQYEIVIEILTPGHFIYLPSDRCFKRTFLLRFYSRRMQQ